MRAAMTQVAGRAGHSNWWVRIPQAPGWQAVSQSSCSSHSPRLYLHTNNQHTFSHIYITSQCRVSNGTPNTI